jgi:hypothetical protein
MSGILKFQKTLGHTASLASSTVALRIRQLVGEQLEGSEFHKDHVKKNRRSGQEA